VPLSITACCIEKVKVMPSFVGPLVLYEDQYQQHIIEWSQTFSIVP